MNEHVAYTAFKQGEMWGMKKVIYAIYRAD